jgi:hypothetical protein
MNRFDNLTPTKDCSNCDVINDYVCFECEDIFMKKNYPNYFYNDDCEWELKPTIEEIEEND